jgi:tRNA pseudouridine55 synthase
MAEGVLLVLLGQATKISGHLMHGGGKIYNGVIRLGVVTDTWDAEGRVLERFAVKDIDPSLLHEVCATFVGSHEQEVPAYSAAKHQGRPLYELARKGLDTPVKKKMVNVYRCEVELVDPERVFFRVSCGSGTYIRSLAHSLGKRLGCGGTLEKLTREYSRPFGMDEAHTLEEVLENPEAFPSRLYGIAEALPDWPQIRLTQAETAIVRNGGRLSVSGDRVLALAPGQNLLLFDADGQVLALGEFLGDSPEQSGVESGVLRITRGLWNT